MDQCGALIWGTISISYRVGSLESTGQFDEKNTIASENIRTAQSERIAGIVVLVVVLRHPWQFACS